MLLESVTRRHLVWVDNITVVIVLTSGRYGYPAPPSYDAATVSSAPIRRLRDNTGVSAVANSLVGGSGGGAATTQRPLPSSTSELFPPLLSTALFPPLRSNRRFSPPRPSSPHLDV